MPVKRISIVIGTLLSVVLVYTAVAIRQPNHFKIRSAESMSAEYLGDDGVILQRAANDCGPSALKMLLNDVGIEVSQEEMEGIIPLTDRGATMFDLRSAAEKKGVKMAGWKLSVDTLPNVRYPAILFIRKNHYIVADSISGKELYARDPSIGRIRIPVDKVSRVWNGEALLILAQKN